MSSVVGDGNVEWNANETELPASSEVNALTRDCSKDNADQLESNKTADSNLPSLPPLPDLIPIRKAGLPLPSLSASTPQPNLAPNVPQADTLTVELEVSSQPKDLEALAVAEEPPAESNHETARSTISQSPQPIDVALDTTETTSSTVATPAVHTEHDNQLAACESNASTNSIKIIISKPSDQKPAAMQDLQPEQPMVQHRKSDRRRVGRDIFFFFEEQRSSRRKGRQTKTGQQKRGRPRGTANKAPPPPKLRIPKREPLTSPEVTTPSSDTTPSTPRVNPIFLWVKQDDTRIVEVRCEDYDKRNRIKLTKTANGWRAIPRTDPTSSRVVKLVPNPIVHVKQEPRPDLLQSTSLESHVSTATDSTAVTQDDYPLLKIKKSKKKKKKKKKKRKEDDEEREFSTMDTVEMDAHVAEQQQLQPPAADAPDFSDIPKILSPAPADIVIYESTNHERNVSPVISEPLAATSVVVAENSIPLLEPNNNNDTTVDLTKNLDPLPAEMDISLPQFMMRQDDNSEPEMILCPETGEFRRIDDIRQQATEATVDLTNSEPDLHETFDVDSKHLKELLESEDLLSHCDGGLSGAELIDSLVKRGCEDNHISEEDQHQIKETICLTDDFENEEEEILMQPEPVEDIISRLGGSLTTSPKCLSFNEAGEIEGLHGELFQNSSNHSDPFISRNTLEELSITIKDLESMPPKTTVDTLPMETAQSTTIVSPDSCVDELPKDLTCKKTADNNNAAKAKEPTPILPTLPFQPQRTNSRSSDAIQSPQPSGLPAVPPSPDIVHSNKTAKNLFLDQLLNHNSISPKIGSSVTVTPVSLINSTTKTVQQKEPLDLGKHRKSASPTVSCSEEAKRSMSSDEPANKRIKTEPVPCNNPKSGTHTVDLVDLLQPAKDPDPLTQLRLLISNPEWKVPDPILVPKDRLSAVLASPAREIPLLLTTRPELRLPEAFAYPSILQDPDILVISMAQLEAILQKQVDIARPKSPPQPQVTIEPVTRPRQEKQTPQPELDSRQKNNTVNPLAPLMGPALANDIDAATLAAFNQMFWLPYISQMAPELFKAMAGLPNNANLAELLPFLAQQQQQHQQQQQQQQQQQKLQQQQQQQQRNLFNTAAAQFNANSMGFQNPLELAMWQEALSQAQMQQALKLQQQAHKKPTTPTETKPNVRQQQSNMAAAAAAASMFAQNKQHQSQQQKSRTTYGINPFRADLSRLQNRQTNHARTNDSQQFLSPTAKATNKHSAAQHHQQQSHSSSLQQNHNGVPGEQKPRVTLKSLSNLLEPERLLSQTDPKMSTNLMAMPGFDFTQNQQALLQQQHHQFAGQFGSTAGSAGQSQQHQQHQQGQQQQQSSGQHQQQQMQGKLKVKPGAHLLDPAAMQRRLLNYDEVPEVGSTTNGLDDIMNDPNALWHPLFGSNQKTGYTSPWQWTTVTATGE